MVIKVHGGVLSTATMRPLVCLYEKGIEFEFYQVDVESLAYKKERFISLNPFGQVPAMEDRDLTLIESRAMCKYIADKYQREGTRLTFPESKERAIMSVWMEVEAHQFNPAGVKLTWELVFKKKLGLENDESAIAENIMKLTAVLDVYEARLSKSKYLGGGEFNLADLYHIPIVHFLIGTSIKKLFEERPHVYAWAGDMLARPSWTKVLQMQNQD